MPISRQWTERRVAPPGAIRLAAVPCPEPTRPGFAVDGKAATGTIDEDGTHRCPTPTPAPAAHNQVAFQDYYSERVSGDTGPRRREPCRRTPGRGPGMRGARLKARSAATRHPRMTHGQSSRAGGHRWVSQTIKMP